MTICDAPYFGAYRYKDLQRGARHGHSSYKARVPRLHNACELNFLPIHSFAKDFSLDTIAPSLEKQPPISSDYTFGVS